MGESNKVITPTQFIIKKIAKRAMAKASLLGIDYPASEAEADIALIHALINLNLYQLFRASDPDFLHDILGIRRNLDRKNQYITIPLKLIHLNNS